MKARGSLKFSLAILMLAMTGCYAPFNPQWGRHEIMRQTGAEPGDAFEFNMGEATMKLAKSVVSSVAGESVNFGGIDRIDVAVYELPQGRHLDFNTIGCRGWEKLINTQGDKSALMILVRSNGDSLRDVVVVAQGEEQLLYGHLKGTLNPGLPSDLQGVLDKKGLQGLKDKILSEAPGKSAIPPPGVKKP
jgi:hypothetical protein